MKRILLIISALAFLWGCEKIGSDEPVKDDTTIEDETPDTEAPDSLQTDYMLPEIIYASMTDEDEDKPQTRTVVGPDGKKILWQKGDAVSFFYGNVHNARYTYNGEDGVTSAELTKDDTKPGTNGDVLLKSQAVYPYNENVTVEYDKDAGLDKIILTYPTTQKYAANSFGKDANIMVAAGKNNEDDKLYFRNACGYLVIKLYGTASIKNITLSSVSGTDKIAGSAVVVASHDAVPVITMTDDASTAVTLDCSDSDAGVALGADAENATEFWFCLPPVTFTDGIKITVNDMSGNTYTKQTSKTVTIERNQIQPMAPLEFVSNAPAATKLWYTRSDDSTDIISFYDGKTNPFDAQITAHKRDGNKFVIEFASPLTTIKEYAFRDTKLATITLPEGITTIEKEAFRNTPLTEITIPGSINTIGVDVFYDCAQLTSVTFLPSPTKTPLSIGYMTYGTGELGAFYDTKLTSIALNRELIYTKGKNDKGEDIIFTPDEYDEGMFYHKNYKGVNSVTVTLGPQVETLSNYMFAYLPIQTLTIPGTVTTIQNDVFYKCTALTSLTFNPSPSGTALTMGYDTDDEDENLFQDNNTLETLNLNREIIYTLDESAIDTDSEGLFGGMETLTNVTLGDQVKTLHKYMFAGSRITNLEIPGSVNTIANDVFHNCTALTSLTFKPSPTKERLTIGFDTYGEDENLFQNYCPLTTLNLDRELDYTLTGVDTESEGLFGGMSKLTSVTLGDQVSTLTPFMFAGSGITSLNLNKVTTIGNSALANTKITSLTVPGCVKTIGNNVFDGCSSLAALTYMPSPNGEVLTHGYNDDSDDDGPFYASPLTSVTLNREIEYTFTSAANASEGLFGNRTTLTNVTIGDQVRTLSPYMFAHAQIPSITIPAGITAIAQNVFDECSALSSITFEESATAL